MTDRSRFPRICFRRAAIVFLLAAAFGYLPLATRLYAQFIAQPVDLPYLCQRADVIVQGQVVHVLEANLPGHPNIPTIEVTLDVEEMLRGKAGKRYTFREVVIGLRPREGKQAYRIGQRLMLFLTSPSRYGLSSPVGIGQGRFHIGGDRSGRAMIVNERNNAELFSDIAETAETQGMKLTAYQMKIAATRRGPVALDGFVSLVKNLTLLPRIR